jgi:TPP-dependent 2-oxoacid decarboxylase
MNTDTSQDIPFIPAPRITTVAGYLLTRLAEAGVRSIFGVPGDYNLGILDAIAARPDLAWIGTATEQGAGYAADGYARLRGLGALVTTFGVGELSALNAIVGAYAESVPVVHVVGTPALAARQTSETLHHNLPGRDYGHLARMAAEVTVARADLRPATAPEQIDRVLSAALRTSRPVYLTIPADVAGIPVLAPAGRLPGLGLRQPMAAAVRTRPDRADFAALPVTETAPRHPRDQRLTQRSLWASLQDFLLPGDLLIADPGTAFYGAAELTLPEGAQLLGQPLWASIGWTVPAALGASLAATDRRVVLVAGDGAMQQAAAELGPLLRQGLVPVIIVLNNGGYTTERGISQPDAGCHDLPAWDWTALPAAVAPASSAVTLRARSSYELARALNAANFHANAGRPVLIEAVLGADDTPPLLRDLTRVLAHR